jgi:hypothetical protein
VGAGCPDASIVRNGNGVYCQPIHLQVALAQALGVQLDVLQLLTDIASGQSVDAL